MNNIQILITIINTLLSWNLGNNLYKFVYSNNKDKSFYGFICIILIIIITILIVIEDKI